MPTKCWKKHPKKLHTYISWELFFSAAPTAQISPGLHFHFINFSAKVSASNLRPDCYFSFKNWNDKLALNFITKLLQKYINRHLFLYEFWDFEIRPYVPVEFTTVSQWAPIIKGRSFLVFQNFPGKMPIMLLPLMEGVFCNMV